MSPRGSTAERALCPGAGLSCAADPLARSPPGDIITYLRSSSPTHAIKEVADMFRTQFVYPFEALLEYRPDGSVATLGPGRHRLRRRARYVPVDLRAARFVLPTQEIAVADGAEVRLSAAVDVMVVDPVLYNGRAMDPHSVVYLAVQVALRDLVAELSVDDVLGRRFDLSGVRRVADQAAASVGLEISGVVIRDVGVPADLQRSRRAAVIAVAEAKAELERARAEAAAMRIRANAAALLERNPVLARIRTLEALPPGAQVVLHVGGAGVSEGGGV